MVNKTVPVHRCRFVAHMPSGINALAYGEHGKVACARANGDIEVWDAATWTLERRVPGIGGGGSIESVSWVSGAGETMAEKVRLFSAGLDGFVTEWDTISLAPVSRVESGGGAVWSMAVKSVKRVEEDEGNESVESMEHIMALACEDGRVRLFSVDTQGVVLKGVCDRMDSRVLSVAFHPTKNMVAAGSSDSCIRIYSTTTFRLLARLTVDTRSGEDTLVWTLAYLSDGTLVAGDSLGTVSFWDMSSFTLMRALKAHLADVLCLAVGKDPSVVFSSGVDRRVIQFSLVDNALEVQQNYMKKKSSKLYAKNWVLTGDRRFHSHDVRALALCESKPFDALVSGGVDATFIVSKTISKFPECKQERKAMFPQNPLISLARDARLLLARFDDHVKIWELGQFVSDASTSSGPGCAGDKLDILKKERLIAEVKIKNLTNLTASAISNDGKFIAVSDLFSTRLFEIQVSPRNARVHTRVTRLKEFPSPSEIPGSTSIEFTPDSKRLVLAGTDSIVRIVAISDAGFPILAQLTQHRGTVGSGNRKNASSNVGFTGRELVSSLAVSEDSQWLATGDLANRIHIFNLDSMKHHVTVPHFKSQHTTFSFVNQSSALVITLNTNEVFLYDAEQRRLTEWSRQNSHLIPERLLSRPEHVMGVESSEAAPGKIVLWSSDYMCTLDTRKPLLANDMSSTRKRKKSRTRNGSTPSKSPLDSTKLLPTNGSAANGHSINANDNCAITISDSEDEIPSTVTPMDIDTKPTYASIVSHAAARTSTVGNAVSMQFKYGPTMFFGFLRGGAEAVVVERPILSVIDALPPGFYRKRYGT
ncbi:U3 small nucleolar RNA-associated protein 4 [Chytriomyces hyalinus]|nr:U3 small nucleolar RNA-associated protein 4 [Chytriomyces hyalinus]